MIPSDAIIAPEKLTQYLLLTQRRNDKSKFLENLGFSLRNPGVLEVAIRLQASASEPFVDGVDRFGTYMTVTGDLVGPAGRREVVTVWVLGSFDNRIRFITLKPSRS